MGGLAGSRCWQLLQQDKKAEVRLMSELGLAPLAARVLAARGVSDPVEAQRFLTPSLERDWSDPLLIPDMEEAVQRIMRAISDGESIAVFGDFDVDGMSAASVLGLGLRALGAQVQAFIPDRFTEGYGLSKNALLRVVEACKPQLVVTVDNGIASAEEVKALLEHNIDVVITDHHEPADLVPTGVPVVDPKLSADCPSRDLAGAGVALKLVCELGRRLGQPHLWRSLTELACLGTVSDMMVLQGENRALVADGIECMHHSTRPGLAALAQIAKVDLSTVAADDLPFSIIPRLNAAGRMGSTDIAFKLLFTDDIEEASLLAASLEQINEVRRETEFAMSEAALAEAERCWDGGRVVVVAGGDWHEGVKGIVASRIVNHYHVPAIVFSLVDGEARGSGRSVGTVDLFHAVEQCADLTIRFGGHAGAVGVTVAEDKIDAFRKRLSAVLAKLPQEQFEYRKEVTALVELSELNVETVASLEALQPFGQGNKKPLFAVRGVSMRDRKRSRNGKHLLFIATDGFNEVPAVMFNAPELERAASTESIVDLVFETKNETWQGRTKTKLMVKDILFRDQPSRGPAPGESLILEGFDPPTPNPAEHRGELAQLDYDELTEVLAAELIGEHQLLPAQREALACLAKKQSTLVVMATGRGKSLIFHVHAAREAVTYHKASVFVYPLRALVNDQARHLQDEFAHIGVGVRVLTGATPQDRRATVWSELADGSCDIVLTTPEFLAIHTDRFAQIARIGFLVVDEAHHVMQATSNRPAYAKFPEIRHKLANPTVLAVTATAPREVALQIQNLLGISSENILIDNAVRKNLELLDCREKRDRELALASLVAKGEKCIIYVNSREESVSLVRKLRHMTGELADRIAYYNAGLEPRVRVKVERAFRDGRLCCIVSTSAFGEGVNIGDVRHVVLYQLPFGRTEFNQMSGRVGRDGLPAYIWLMFSARDASVNERLLAAAAPTRDELKMLWRALRLLEQTSHDDIVRVSDEELAAQARLQDGRYALDAQVSEAGIAVFAELGLLQLSSYGPTREIKLTSNPPRMNLAQSARYVEGIRAAEDFAEFREWVLRCAQAELLDSINKPIVPGFGHVVCGG